MSTKHLIFGTTLCLALLSLCPITHAATDPCAGVKQPASNGVANFYSEHCFGRSKDTFTSGQMRGDTAVAGMLACRGLEASWRTYCACQKKDLNARPETNPAKVVFGIIDCGRNPNWQIFCGAYECRDPSPMPTPTAAPTSAPSSPSY